MNLVDQNRPEQLHINTLSRALLRPKTYISAIRRKRNTQDAPMFVYIIEYI